MLLNGRLTANQEGAAAQHIISAKCAWRTILKDSVIESLHHKAPGAFWERRGSRFFVVATTAAAQS